MYKLNEVLNRPNIYFLGGGGIGMSALMRYFMAQGRNVGGYDKTPTGLTELLIQEGAELNFEDKIESIGSSFLNPENTLVIYTPAIPKDSEQLNFFQSKGFPLYKRAAILGLITQSNYSVAVAGTHGKTTISSMVAHCLKFAAYPLTAFLGGISKNLKSNYYHDTDSKVTVIEADEYDRSFLQLQPDIIGISAVDPDHLDIYGTEQEMQRTFRQFLTENLRKNGTAIIEKKLVKILGENYNTYSISDATVDFFADNIKIDALSFKADFHWKGGTEKDIEIGLPGIHNLENALLCFAICLKIGIPSQVLKLALGAYKGVDRRFDVHINQPKCLYIDDYAHHPEEIRNLVLSVKKMFPHRKITGIFQPHLFSRTQDFLQGFIDALELLDSVVLLEIYPAREKPIPGVNSTLILEGIQKNSKMLCSKKELLDYLLSEPSDVVLTIGAGDIGMEVDKVKETLLKRLKLGK